MKYRLLLLLAICFGCSASNSFPKSSFLVNGKYYNRLIAERSTKQKVGPTTGCMRIEQMDLILSTLRTDSIEGLLVQSRGKFPVPFAKIQVVQEGIYDTLEIVTTFDGKFLFAKEPKAIQINVNYLGYNSLEVDLMNLKK